MVAVTRHTAAWIGFLQPCYQLPECYFLFCGARVLRCLSVLGIAANVTYPDAMLIVSHTVGTHHFHRSPLVYAAVQVYYVVIAAAVFPVSVLAMPAVNVLNRKVLPFWRCRAVKDDFIDRSHIIGYRCMTLHPGSWQWPRGWPTASERRISNLTFSWYFFLGLMVKVSLQAKRASSSERWRTHHQITGSLPRCCRCYHCRSGWSCQTRSGTPPRDSSRSDPAHDGR